MRLGGHTMWVLFAKIRPTDTCHTNSHIMLVTVNYENRLYSSKFIFVIIGMKNIEIY